MVSVPFIQGTCLLIRIVHEIERGAVVFKAEPPALFNGGHVEGGGKGALQPEGIP